MGKTFPARGLTAASAATSSGPTVTSSSQTTVLQHVVYGLDATYSTTVAAKLVYIGDGGSSSVLWQAYLTQSYTRTWAQGLKITPGNTLLAALEATSSSAITAALSLDIKTLPTGYNT